DNGFCAIGSVKSNIGHGESAAGIAGVTKIVLQLKHGLLAPSIHAQQLNPNIDFENSPFVVQQELSEWKRPSIGQNGHTQECPRRAGISSFGAGGSNAHLIIEEFDGYIPQREKDEGAGVAHIILLSARNIDRLKELIADVWKVMKSGRFKDNDLGDIAFTLQTGRDHLETRLATIVRSIDELCQKLDAFNKEVKDIDGLYFGRLEKDNETMEVFTADEDLREAIERWIERKKYGKLCEFWVKGLWINWSAQYKRDASNGRLPKRVSLPTYPFARERYWVPGAPTADTTAEEAYPLMTFTEEWVEQPIEEDPLYIADQPAYKTIACFLSASGHRAAISAAFTSINRGCKLLFISSD